MQRPTAITIFGGLNIAFAGVGFFGLISTAALFFMPSSSDNPVLRMMQNNPDYVFWLKLTVPLGLVSSAVLLAAGIGLLYLKPWARIASIGYAIYAILFNILGTVMNYLFLVRPLLEEAATKKGPEAAGAIAGAVSTGVGGCFGLVYPILLLIFMMRPKLAAAFRSSAAPPALPPAPTAHDG